MATITGLTAARMQEIIDKTIVDADIVGQHLILTLEDGSTIDAGAVGPSGKGTAFPAGATDGDLFVRTDQPGDPLYKYTDGAWLLFTGGGVTKGTAFPTFPVPSDGDLVVRTDQVGDPIYKYTDGVWERQPRMGALTPSAARATIAAGAQSVGAGVTSVVAFPTEDFDTDTMHDVASNTTRLTIKTPGLYQLDGFAESSVAPTGNAPVVNIYKNGALLGPDPYFLGVGQSSRTRVSGVVRLAAGDYIELAYVNNSTGSLTIGRAYLSAIWLGGAGQTVDERGVPAFGGYLSANQLIPGGAVATKLLFNGETYDTDGCFDPSLGRFTAKTAGLYNLKVFLPFEDNGGAWIARLYKNGARYKDILSIGDQAGTNNPYIESSWQVLVAAGDYFEVFVFNTVGGSFNIFGGALEYGRAEFSGALAGSAKTVTPYAKANNASGQSIPNDTPTVVALPTESSDNDGIHDTVTNNSRLVCRTAGVYLITGQLGFAANSTGIRRAAILVNGSAVGSLQGHQAAPSPSADYSNVSEVVELAVGDYVELQAYQTSGGALSLVTSTIACELSMVKIGAPNAGGTGLGSCQADVYTVSTLPAANTFPNGRIVGVSDGAAGQQARMSMNGAWINLG